YEVSEEELTAFREACREGRATAKVEEDVFDLAAYERFLIDNAASIEAFQAKQKVACEEEVARWQADASLAAPEAVEEEPAAVPEVEGHTIHADITGSIWKLLVEPGQIVQEDEPLLIVEAMKMEF